MSYLNKVISKTGLVYIYFFKRLLARSSVKVNSALDNGSIGAQ